MSHKKAAGHSLTQLQKLAYRFFCILLVISQSLRVTQFKGQRHRLHVSMGGQKMCTRVLKPPQGFSSEGWLIVGLSDIPCGSPRRVLVEESQLLVSVCTGSLWPLGADVL